MEAGAGAAVEHARQARPAGPVSEHGRSGRRKWTVRLTKGAAILSLTAAIGSWMLLRLVGESWWVTTVGLYLPRLALAFPLPLVAAALFALRQPRWLWTQAVAALVVLFPVMGFVAPWPHGTDPRAPRVRVLSYNINSAYGGADAIVEEVDRYSPDIVLLQEVGHVEALEPSLQARYPTVEVNGQFVLASRFPLLSKLDPPKLPYYGQDRSPRYLRRVFDTPLGPIAFYNVHPVSPREDFSALRGRGLRREILSGHLFSGDAAPLISRNAGLRGLQVNSFSDSAAAETAPVIVAGDTNLPGLSKIFGRYLSRFTDGFREAGWGLGYTYPNNRRPWMRIDKILASEQLRFVGFAVGTSNASDHLCVVADLQRR